MPNNAATERRVLDMPEIISRSRHRSQQGDGFGEPAQSIHEKFNTGPSLSLRTRPWGGLHAISRFYAAVHSRTRIRRIMKNRLFGESMRLQFRAEMFDIFHQAAPLKVQQAFPERVRRLSSQNIRSASAVSESRFAIWEALEADSKFATYEGDVIRRVSEPGRRAL
jgi:hypothetical protein